MTSGYACTVNGAIRVDTVSPTKRGAMVNGLTTLFGVLVTQFHSNEWIENAYTQFTADSKNVHNLERVTIVVAT